MTFDPAELDSALAAIHDAGMPGVYAEVRAGDRRWQGAAGVADLETGRPVEPELRQRIGSVTKTFVGAAVLRLAEQGRIGLDDPIGDYLPQLVPGERGRAITIRMLLNHTSGLPEYLPYAFPSFRGFPSLRDISPDSLDDNRFRTFDTSELIAMGVTAPAAGAPGEEPGTYSNTNYLLLGELMEQVTALTAAEYVTNTVIEPAGLAHTGFPAGPEIDGPHSRMYEALFGLIDPPRDYSVYTPSWVPTGAGMVSTMPDLNRFFAHLINGSIITRESLAQMQHTVPVIALDRSVLDYGLGLHRFSLPGRGTIWGNDGTTWGAYTMSMISADGARQFSVAMNLMRWNQLDSSARPKPHPLDEALAAFSRVAMAVQPER